MISVVILTMNEEANLPRCLESVRFSNDVVVVDSGSRDKTKEIARAYGVRVFENEFESFAAQRNFAMKQDFRNRWALHLDADEVVTPSLANELLEVATRRDTKPVYRVASKLIFMDKWVRFAGMYPSYQVRFGRVGDLVFVDHGHGQRETQPPEEVGTLQSALLHFNFSKGINDWMGRHLRYALDEAIDISGRRSELSVRGLFHRDATERRRAVKEFANLLPCRPFFRFFYTYVIRGGFLDGAAGWHYARLMGTYQYLIDLNRAEIEGGFREVTRSSDGKKRDS